jgi:hypothetical protein
MTDDLDTLDRDESDDEEDDTTAEAEEEPQPWAKTSSGDAENV